MGTAQRSNIEDKVLQAIHNCRLYRVDFVSLKSQLIIEEDGAYHSEYEQQQYDEGRTERLESLGFTLIRFTNDEVILQTDHVIDKIKEILHEQEQYK